MTLCSPLHAMNRLWRDPSQDQDAEAILVGDVYEFTDRPVYEVDRITRTAKSTLQCFQVTDDKGGIRPVKRGSWLPTPAIEGPKRSRKHRYKQH